MLPPSNVKKIYICHAYGDDCDGNQIRVAAIARRLALQGHLPLAPQLLFPHFLAETTERRLALKLCLELLAAADEVRTYGEVSAGMRVEIVEAERLGIPVVREEFP